MYQNNYDDNNIFAKILRAEIPCTKVYEDEAVLAFEDINPQAKTHVLVIPRGRYVSFSDFSQNAGARGVGIFFNRVGFIANKLDADGNGYRLITNTGVDSGQEVPHFHVHILSGETLGSLNAKS